MATLHVQVSAILDPAPDEPQVAALRTTRLAHVELSEAAATDASIVPETLQAAIEAVSRHAPAMGAELLHGLTEGAAHA